MIAPPWSHACDVEGRRGLRPGQRAGQALLRDQPARRPAQHGAPGGRRSDPLPQGVQRGRGGGAAGRDRPRAHHRGRRRRHAGRGRPGLPAHVHGPRHRGPRVRPRRPGRPDHARQDVLPGARGEGGQAVRPAAGGPGADRPDGRGHGDLAPARVHGRAPRARRRHRPADDALAGRGAGAGVRRPGHAGRRPAAGAADGRLARGVDGRRLRPGPVRGRLDRRAAGPDHGQDRGR